MLGHQLVLFSSPSSYYNCIGMEGQFRRTECVNKSNRSTIHVRKNQAGHTRSITIHILMNIFKKKWTIRWLCRRSPKQQHRGRLDGPWEQPSWPHSRPCLWQPGRRFLSVKGTCSCEVEAVTTEECLCWWQRGYRWRGSVIHWRWASTLSPLYEYCT